MSSKTIYFTLFQVSTWADEASLRSAAAPGHFSHLSQLLKKHSKAFLLFFNQRLFFRFHLASSQVRLWKVKGIIETRKSTRYFSINYFLEKKHLERNLKLHHGHQREERLSRRFLQVNENNYFLFWNAFFNFNAFWPEWPFIWPEVCIWWKFVLRPYEATSFFL